MTKQKNKAKERVNQPRAASRIEYREYGTIKVSTPREGIKIEQLVKEKSDKKKSSR